MNVSTSTGRRAGILAYGVASYAVVMTALVYLILLMLGVLDFRSGPIRIDSPALAGLFDVGLVVAFAVQHSVMARAGFKERWMRIIHPSMERSSYLLATGLFLLPIIVLWQPLPTVVWAVHAPLVRAMITGIAVLGWAYLFLASFAINHFEFGGLHQVWRGFRGQSPASLPFRERWMYRFDRHPIMIGLLVGVWMTPEMTLGHLVFSGAFSVNVVVGVQFEERALRRQFGDTYEAYSRRVPTIVPVFRSR